MRTIAGAVRALGAVGTILIVALCRPGTSRTSPFELWTLRPGDSLATVTERVRRVGRTGLACGPLVGPWRYCAVRSTGAPLTAAPGSLYFVVDSANVVTVIQFRRNEYTPPALRDQMAREWADEVRRLTTEWEHLPGATTSERAFASYRMQRWTTGDSGWSADVRYDPRETVAQAVTLTNESAWRGLRAYSPLADYVLSQRGLVGEATDIPAILLGALALREPPPMSLGTPPAVSIPECELELADVVIQARPGSLEQGESRASLGEQSAAVAETAVPVAYPGWRLAFGQHVYLVSPSGTAEQVNMQIQRDYQSQGIRDGENIYAIAIQRPRRADSARRRLESLDPGAQCSSRDDVVFVRRASDGTIAESVRVPIDDEAPLTSISRIEFVPAMEGRGSLVVGYVASYGTERWSGEVEWRAEIATDPPRVIGRTPVSFQKLERDAAAPGKGILITRLVGDTLAVHTLSDNGSAVWTQTVRIPLGTHKALPGARLLEQLH